MKDADRPDLDTAPEGDVLGFLRWLVYGLGRGTGIHVLPRHLPRDPAEAIRRLTSDVVAARKEPPDDVLGTRCSHLANRLVEMVDRLPSREVARVLVAYVEARLEHQQGIVERHGNG
jgi:hypothetical protein